MFVHLSSVNFFRAFAMCTLHWLQVQYLNVLVHVCTVLWSRKKGLTSSKFGYRWYVTLYGLNMNTLSASLVYILYCTSIINEVHTVIVKLWWSLSFFSSFLEFFNISCQFLQGLPKLNTKCLPYVYLSYGRGLAGNQEISPSYHLSEYYLFAVSCMLVPDSVYHFKQPYRVDKPKTLLIPTKWISSVLIVGLYVLVWRNHQYIIPWKFNDHNFLQYIMTTMETCCCLLWCVENRCTLKYLNTIYS